MDNLMNSIGLVNNESKTVNLVSEIPEDIIIAKETINGIEYPRVAWVDIVNRFPGMWVHKCNSETVRDGRCFVTTVLSICSDDDMDAEIIRLSTNKYIFSSRRTTSELTVGVQL